MSVLPTDKRKVEPRPPSRTPPSADEMLLDAQTFKDLEIFEAESAGASLFDLCNFTRNEGGEKALRARMERPWSNPARILATQEALTYVMEQRQCFDRLPSYVNTDVVEEYVYGALPLLDSGNVLEFGIGVLELRFGDIRHYSRIYRGVQAASELIRSLRLMAGALEKTSPRGEIASLIEEMHALLARPGFALVPEKETWNLNAWTVLRIDQVYRMHEKQAVDRLLQLTYEMDMFVSMADANRKHGFVMPRVSEGPLAVQAEGLVHPFVGNAVPNPVALDQSRRLLFLTGPNMAGKTTYLRACGIAFYLAHLGMGVPAREFRFVPAQRLFSSISLTDDLRGGVSFFRAEALRVKAIAQALADGYRVIALMDEPFKGTNIKDAFDASLEILTRFAEREHSLFMFSSHMIELSEQMSATDQVDCRHFEAGEREDKLHFGYVLRPGVSNQRLGMRVLRDEGIFELLDAQVEAAGW